MSALTKILKRKIGKDGVSKTYVASQLGVSEKTIENYMNGARSPKPDTIVKLAEILDFNLNELSEQNVLKNGNDTPRAAKQDRYTRLLEDNDRFFKTTYSDLMANLGKLFDQSKNLESLIKLNLKHIGTVEALQQGLAPDEIQAQINNEIANEVLKHTDNAGDNQGKRNVKQ